MDAYRERVISAERRRPKRKLSVTLLAGSLLVSSACTDEPEQEPTITSVPETTPTTETALQTTATTLEVTTTTEVVDETTEVAAEDCSFRFVQPGEHFTPENEERLAEDLALLEKLHTEGTSLELGDIGTAAGIMRRSYQDPLYAEAMVQAKDAAQEQEFANVESFLATEVSQPDMCDNNHLETDDSRVQLQRTVSIGQTLSRRVGERIGEQTSDAIRRAYEIFEESVRELVEELEDTE